MNVGIENTEVGPGDSFSIKPKIYNDSTVDMYVFIRIDMTRNEEGPIYTYETNDVRKLVDSYDGVAVYAYGDSEMYVLTPGEATIPLFEMMTMKSISNA